MNEPVPGRYRHYKGNEYTVLGVARHSETLDELVVYRAEYGEHGLWVRPRRMFLETVNVNGQDVPRFQRLPSETEREPSSIRNLFQDLPGRLPDEIVNTLLTARGVRIERIVSQGQSSPRGFWYDQDENEWVLVLRGAARIQFEGDVPPAEMKRGDFLSIPAHEKHRVEWTTPDEPTIWLAVHFSG